LSQTALPINYYAITAVLGQTALPINYYA